MYWLLISKNLAVEKMVLPDKSRDFFSVRLNACILIWGHHGLRRDRVVRYIPIPKKNRNRDAASTTCLLRLPLQGLA